MRISACVFLLAASLSVSAATDESHKHHAPPDAKVGQVKFPTTCAPAVQPDFERAVAMLHSFWYDEAERAFNSVAQKDPDCAMAYWGAAMSLHHPLWAAATPVEYQRGLEAMSKAKAAKKATPRERAFIDALAGVYATDKPAPLPVRNKAFAEGMEKVHAAYPQDDEAAIFYALALRSTAAVTDKSYAVQRKVGTIIDPLFAKMPHHPGLAHYVIHNYDYPELASLGLDAARRYAKIAPAAPHALHMPSHIFIRLGLWDDAINSNIDSASAARAHYKASGSQASLGEQLHAMDYMTYGYLQKGELQKAAAVRDELKRLHEADWNNFGAYHAASAIPARVALESRRWAEARALPEPTFTGGTYWTQVANGITYWARSLGAARTGDAAESARGIAKLTELRDQLNSAGQEDGAATVEVLLLSAQGWNAHAKRNSEEAVRLLRAAADLEDRTDKHPVTPGSVLPAREQLADLLAEIGRPAEALVAYEESMKSAPNRFNSLLGAARAASAAKNGERAAQHWNQLKKVAPNADPQLLGKTPTEVAAK